MILYPIFLQAGLENGNQKTIDSIVVSSNDIKTVLEIFDMYSILHDQVIIYTKLIPIYDNIVKVSDSIKITNNLITTNLNTISTNNVNYYENQIYTYKRKLRNANKNTVVTGGLSLILIIIIISL